MPPYLSQHKSGRLRLEVWAQPGARRTALAGLHDGRLRVRLASPPVNGRANDELIRFLCRTLSLPRHAIELAAGAADRRKSLWLSGIPLEQAAARLGGGAALPDPGAP